MRVHDGDFIVTKSVYVIFMKPEFCIVDQELPYASVPVGEDKSAGPSVTCEVQAVIVIAVLVSVKKIQSFVAKTTAGMVVNHVEQHSDAVNMANVDQRFQLIDLAGEVSRGKGWVRLSFL